MMVSFMNCFFMLIHLWNSKVTHCNDFLKIVSQMLHHKKGAWF